MSEFASEMRLYDPTTHERLYVNTDERERFLAESSKLKKRNQRLLCHVLHWTGARITEVLELTPDRIEFDSCSIRFRTIKKRKLTRAGEPKSPQFRNVPVPAQLLDALDLYFDLRSTQKRRSPALHRPLWAHTKDATKPMPRLTGWRIVTSVFEAAGIQGPQATPKGFRHGFGVAMILGGMDLNTLQKRLGHENSSTTAIYTQVLGLDAHQHQMNVWQRVGGQSI